MAASRSDDPTNARVISKGDALSICRAAMSQVVSQICGSGNLHTLVIPEGYEAGDVAAAIGGLVVSSGVASKNGVLVRIVTVRIAVGLLMASTTAEQLPTAMFRIEQVSSDLGLARVTPTILKTAVQKETSSIMPELAQSVKQLAPIIGDCPLIKTISAAAAECNVIGYALQLISFARAEHAGEFTAEQNVTSQKTCCDAATDGFNQAWKKAAATFHSHSYLTKTGVARFYGKRATRRS